MFSIRNFPRPAIGYPALLGLFAIDFGIMAFIFDDYYGGPIIPAIVGTLLAIVTMQIARFE
ncbi:MAG: hypothetical protein IPN84_17765 [Sphingomonadales bacterium]|nr:hypothetical protein [Sphingomonadales bacterium]